MMVRVSTPGLLAGFFVVAAMAPFSIPLPAQAQSEITVYAPFRGIATPIARAGSSVSVITREDIEQAGQTSVAEILSSVPGVNVNTAGGPSGTSDIRIRGTETQHTMVLIDGVPVSETTSTRNTFDFRTLPANIIESIEILRGPQSALYGSDAIGGVINIITKQASNGFSGSASVEGGSFGTHREILQLSYGGNNFGVLGSFSHSASSGFTAQDDGVSEEDGFRQYSGFVRATANLSENLTLDGQFSVSDTTSEFDSLQLVFVPAFGFQTVPIGEQDRLRFEGSFRARHSSFDDRWQQTLTVFAARTDLVDTSIPINKTAEEVTESVGDRYGLDYTSQFGLDALGTLLVGAGMEEQTASLERSITVADNYSADDFYWNAFALHQFSLGPAFHLSAAARFDDFGDAGTFLTGRGTAVYEIFETETRLRASVGTGAKAPSLFQRFGTATTNPNLLPEESFGVDAGISQVLFDGRLTVDITGFYNSIDNLIIFDSGPDQYLNVDEAETYGVEVTAETRLVPGHIDASAAYTYLVANDLVENRRLPRRPEHEGQVSLTYYGIERLSVTGTAVFIAGEHVNRYSTVTGEPTPLDPYIRFDLSGTYQANDRLELFGRVENLFDAEYEDRSGFNTPGLSGYVGVRTTF